MSKEEETDAATVLSQMSQLAGIPTFDLSSNLTQDVILEADTIGATCTLHPSSLDQDILFPLSSNHSLTSGRKGNQDPYITFDDAEHPYAANFGETNSFINYKPKQKDLKEVDVTLSPSPSFMSSSSSERNELTCSKCGEQFKKHCNLLVHMESHSNKLHTCVDCFKMFATKSNLKRHSKLHGKGNSNILKCEECGKEFRDQATKTRHKRIHSTSKQLNCNLCDKKFTRKDSLKAHQKSHLVEKPFKCNTCFAEFIYKSSFNRHMLAHDSDTLFICEICGKAFKRFDYVLSHKKSVHQKKENQTNTEGEHKSSVLLKKEKHANVKRANVKTKNNINAIPILMSMAENAAKPKLHQKTTDTSDDLIDSELNCEDNSSDVPSPNIGGDLIAFINNDEERSLNADSASSSDVEIISDPTELDADQWD